MLTTPIHPALVHFPIAMLTATWVCLLVFHATRRDEWDARGRLFEVVGVATLPFVIVAGFVDANDLASFTSPRWDLPLVWHAIVSTTAALTYAGHWWWRRGRSVNALLSGRGVAIDLGAATAATWLLVLTGLIAGEMVYGA